MSATYAQAAQIATLPTFTSRVAYAMASHVVASIVSIVPAIGNLGQLRLGADNLFSGDRDRSCKGRAGYTNSHQSAHNSGGKFI